MGTAHPETVGGAAMLSYRHAFHAGNHADVFKHLVLTLLVRSFHAKDKPAFFLDTHAGAGLYDLGSSMAGKNREFQGGIERLWSEQQPPAAVADFLALIADFNEGRRLRFYPGSPRIARGLLRLGDRLALCELHSTEIDNLRREFDGDRSVKVHHLDAYQALKALLPPKERRGLVLIDPAFEVKDERKRLLDALTEALRRWATGVYAIWYPIQDRATADDFLRRLIRMGLGKVLLAELSVLPCDEARRLNGSGMVVINPPWRLDEELQQLLPWLWEKLAVDRQGSWRLEWLAGGR